MIIMDMCKCRWSQPEIAIWWDGIQLDDREEWNEDWAIVDGAGKVIYLKYYK